MWGRPDILRRLFLFIRMFGVVPPKDMRNSPPTAVWRGKSVKTTLRKTAKTTSAGKNVQGQHEIPRQNHFGGEYHY